MKITLDENYYAKTDFTALGYVGETNARAITIEGYQCEGADSYKMRFKYPDGVIYDVDISAGTYTIEGSILRRVGDVYLQILACRSDGDQYEYVKKSNILTLHICSALNGDVAPVPTYEKSVEALEKVIAAEKSSSENVSKAESASNAAQAAQNAAEQAKQTAVELAANAEKAAENAAQSERAAQTAAEVATDKAAEISKSAEQIQKNTDDIAKLYSKSDGIICNAEGTEITLNDSSDLGFSGMKIFGRSTQETTTGVQLLNISECNIPTQIGKITLKKSDGSITLSGSPTVSSDGNVFTHFLGEYIDILDDGKTYSASGFCKFQVVENGVNRYWTKVTVNKSTMTNIKPYLQVSEKDYYDGMTIYPMLNEGDTVLAWEPYTGGQPSPNPEYPQEIVSVGNSGGINVCANGKNLLQTINISTPNGLPGIPVDSGGNYTDENGQQWVCDEVDLQRGVYVQRIYEQIFNGTENWKMNDTGTKYFMLSGATPNVSEKSNQLIGLCDKTKIISYKDTDRGTGYGIAFIYYWRCNFAECDAISGATVDDLKLFLAENPMKIMYAGVPIETPLTAEQIAAYKSLHTNKPTTVITNSDNAHMAASYTADTKTYIDNKFNELATAIIATGGDT